MLTAPPAAGARRYPTLTVAICTHNRCALLAQTLEQMTRLHVPAGVEWELIVVDNNSTDDTRRVLAEYGERLPLRALFEPRLGVANARNRSVAETRGEYMVCTDDDVLVDERWLAAYLDTFLRYPEAAVFGGPIAPWFVGEPPAWLRESVAQVAGAYALKNWNGGDRELSIAADLVPFGANMALRTDALRSRPGPYDPALGRRGKGMLGGEETVLAAELLRSGLPGRWVAGARVRHYLPAERQTVGYLRRFYSGYGATLALIDPANADVPRLFGVPRWAWRQALKFELRYRVNRVFSSPKVWIEDLKQASIAWGHLRVGEEAASVPRSPS